VKDIIITDCVSTVQVTNPFRVINKQGKLIIRPGAKMKVRALFAPIYVNSAFQLHRLTIRSQTFIY